MNNEAMEETESIRPRFLDFKIYADAEHHLAGYGANLLPYNPNVTPIVTIVPGEWESSKVVIPRTDSTTGIPAPRELIAVGESYPGVGSSGLNAVSLIEGYANSRALPSVLDPNTPDDASDTSGVAPENWMSALFNDGIEQTEEVIEDLQTENNIAPYPFENGQVPGAPAGVTFPDTMYPNGETQMSGLQLHDFETITGTTIGGITRVKGGMFPCGLVRIDHITTDGVANLAIQVDLVPGQHRGYLCSPMTEM